MRSKVERKKRASGKDNFSKILKQDLVQHFIILTKLKTCRPRNLRNLGNLEAKLQFKFWIKDLKAANPVPKLEYISLLTTHKKIQYQSSKKPKKGVENC